MDPMGRLALSVPLLPLKWQRNLFPGPWSRCSHQDKIRGERLLPSSPVRSLVAQSWHSPKGTTGPWRSNNFSRSSNCCFARWKIIKALVLFRALGGAERGEQEAKLSRF